MENLAEAGDFKKGHLFERWDLSLNNGPGVSEEAENMAVVDR